MRSARLIFTAIMALLMAVTALAPLVSLHAQGNAVTILLTIPALGSEIFTPKLLGEFESSHPGIKVQTVKTASEIPQPALGLDKHFEAVEKYASSGDVLYVATGDISAEATRAGYFLDLAPLANEDKSLNADDFYPTIWQSFQWDKGIWAMPFGADAYVLTYSPDAFDKAGLPYPNDKWTINDLTNAIRKLAVKDADGKISKPGMDVLPFNQAYFFRAILSNSIIDTSTFPNTPHFATAEAAALLDTWLKLDKDGYIGQDFNKAPLSAAPAVTVALQLTPGEKRAGALLPGGKGALNVQAFAVSGGTQHPEQAYALAQWLTTRGEVANNGFASSPARKSLLGGPSSDQVVFQINVTPEIQALIDNAIANAIPNSEMRFVDYLAVAYNRMKIDNIDPMAALQQAESAAIKAQQTAAAKKDQVKTALVVATPAPANSLPADKIELKFGVVANTPVVPNKAAWEKLIADFTTSDPKIGKITLEQSTDPIERAYSKYDCFYLPYNGVSADKLSKIIPLDAFIAADSTFDKADMVNGVMAQVQFDNKTWALPSDIAPNILKYDAAAFQKAGVPTPGLTWTTNDFADALKQLKTDPAGKPAFIPVNTFGAYFLDLVTAYGGLPLDYRTNPPTVNFSDPATVDAIRQVTDLAKKGYFKYHALFSSQLDFVLLPEKSVIKQDTLSANALRSPLETNSANDGYKLTLFPKGTKYAAITYGIGTLYISAQTQNPEACYRWISAVAKTPTLFSGMPARRSMISDPTLTAVQGPDTVAVYKQIDTLLQSTDTISLPAFSQGTSLTEILLQLELFNAVDKYMLKDADLESTLKDADSSAKAFQGCAVNLPPFDASTAEAQKTYFKAFKECAVKADKDLGTFFAGIKTD